MLLRIINSSLCMYVSESGNEYIYASYVMDIILFIEYQKCVNNPFIDNL